MDTTEAVVPLAGTGIVGGDRERVKEEEEAAVGGDGEVPVEEIVKEIPVVPRIRDEPKGKGIAMKVPAITPRPLGLTASDYVVSARQEDVMEREQENLGILDVVLKEMREAEIARVWAAAEGERDAEAWALEFEEEEEGEDEVETWI